jgi:hypothetical protein
MSSPSPADVVRAVKSAHARIVTVTGVVIGITLVLYFFSFAQLIDRGYTGMVWFLVISSVVMVLVLCLLKRFSFALLKLFYGRRAAYRPLLSVIRAADLDQDDEVLVRRLAADGVSR